LKLLSRNIAQYTDAAMQYRPIS